MSAASTSRSTGCRNDASAPAPSPSDGDCRRDRNDGPQRRGTSHAQHGDDKHPRGHTSHHNQHERSGNHAWRPADRLVLALAGVPAASSRTSTGAPRNLARRAAPSTPGPAQPDPTTPPATSSRRHGEGRPATQVERVGTGRLLLLETRPHRQGALNRDAPYTGFLTEVIPGQCLIGSPECRNLTCAMCPVRSQRTGSTEQSGPAELDPR